MFPEVIVEAVFMLRNLYKGRKNCVVMNYPIIEIIKYHKDSEVSIKLFYFSNTNTFEIQPPDKRFYTKISYYDYSRPERRWTRDKGFLFSMIGDLKYCELWNLVSNKNFLVVNSCNEKITTNERVERLKKVTDT